MNSPDQLIDTLQKAVPLLEQMSDQASAKAAYQGIIDSLKHDRDHRSSEADRLWAYRRFALLLAFTLGIGTMAIAGYSVYTSGSVSVGTGILLSSILGLGSAFLWGFRPQQELDGSSSAFAIIGQYNKSKEN